MENNPPSNKKKQQLTNYARYSSMGIQMFVIITLGTYAGIKLDAYFGMHKKPFTIVFSLLSIFGAIYYVVRGLIKK